MRNSQKNKTFKNKTFKKSEILKLISSVFLLWILGCSAGHNETNVELMQDMMDQKNLKSQDFDQFRNKPGNMVPPQGTIPRGYTPYKYAGNPLAAEATLVNPLLGEKFGLSLTRGQQRYAIFCSACHGLQGQGDGKVAQYMPLKPPSLMSDKVKNFKDGRIFHIIVDGQGVMGSYATQIFSEEDRWAIVNYIRSLQKQ